MCGNSSIAFCALLSSIRSTDTQQHIFNCSRCFRCFFHFVMSRFFLVAFESTLKSLSHETSVHPRIQTRNNIAQTVDVQLPLEKGKISWWIMPSMTFRQVVSYRLHTRKYRQLISSEFNWVHFHFWRWFFLCLTSDVFLFIESFLSN